MEMKEMLIGMDNTIKDAMKQMDGLMVSTLFVIEENNKLTGCITDGDIRRAILKRISINESIAKAMNFSPMKIFEEDLLRKDQIEQKMLEHTVNHVPLIDNEGKIVAVYDLSYFSVSKNPFYKFKTSPIIIMAGGEGTRLRPLTGILPKPLAPLGDQPVIKKIIENFRKYGFHNFKVSVNYMAEMIKSYFNYIKSDGSISYNISFVNEDEEVGEKLGTIGALALMKNDLKEPFFVSNCDILVDANYNEILKFHHESGNVMTIVGALRNTKIPYGVLNLGNEGVLRSIKEKPEFDHLINTGMYVLNPEIVDLIPYGKKFDMTDLIAALTGKGLKIGVFPVRSNQWFDIGQWKEYEEVLKNVENKNFESPQS